jgi:predicted RecB family nuclease
MQKLKDQFIFSASDLLNFLECDYITKLDLINLETPLPKAPDDEQAAMIQAKGFEHEAAYLQKIRNSGLAIGDLREDRGTPGEKQELTLESMRKGYDIIYQATLASGDWMGYADFLRRVEQPSALGEYSYEVIDTKLARTPKAKFIIQLCFYSELLTGVQGSEPNMMHIALGDGTERSYRVANFSRYYRKVKERLLEYVADHQNSSYPEKSEYCLICRWREICKEQWLKDDYLNQVANITQLQIRKLKNSGIGTLKQLAEIDPAKPVQKIAPDSLGRLQAQASLQLKKRDTGKSVFEVLPIGFDERRGFLRLPERDEGDIFFDMEGDPLREEGLEYLFGLYFIAGGNPCFKDFWAHCRNEERLAFEAFIDFVIERQQRFPNMHVYHYAHYEETALKKLMSMHGTREKEVDHLLRTKTLVDLYKVVRESIRVSESGYSIKDLEVFYMDQRQGEVKDAGASIIYYEKYRETGDKSFLEQIRCYNEDDCRSTYLLHRWLLRLRPENLPWFKLQAESPSEPKSARVSEIETRLAVYSEALLGDLPADLSQWDPEEHARELVYQLLDFHRRTKKPLWWAMFSRSEMTDEELIEDIECIGMLTMEGRKHPPEVIKRSIVYTYSFPEQEFKMREGDQVKCNYPLQSLGTIESIDEKERLIRIKVSPKFGEPPERLSIIPGDPFNTDILTEAIFRFADSVINKDLKYKAVQSFLQKEPPVLKGHKHGDPLVSGNDDTIRGSIDVISNLDSSYLFIQGPPGAGKTFTGSHIIAELLKRGFKIGVSSNSHKAINNLLQAVEQRASESGIHFTGAKKSSNDDQYFKGSIIKDVSDNKDIFLGRYDLVAGTAWLFSATDMDQRLDYLFIDEAGQVSVANLVAMGLSARNIVLLGDQMQLGQPIQGIHPGRSGDSVLEFLLDGKATIESDRGIFLNTTWRMHEDICKFISDAVYDGQLHPEAKNQNQRLMLSNNCHKDLRPTGIRFIKVDHDACSQKSIEEANVVQTLFNSLLAQQYRDKNGEMHPMGKDNILVVAPYNLQVHLLRQVLPDNARVGTVDKFQGQEAEVVIISMATSSGDYLPRQIEFLYDKNRLNVAMSRAKCLALLVANPALMAIKCNTIEQIELVNTLCWVDEYSKRFE